MSKRRKPKRAVSTPAPANPDAAERSRLPELLSGIQLLLIGTLICARYFLPAESAPLGDTLPITLGWFLVAILFSGTLLIDKRSRLRFDRFDFGVWLLVLGQVISTLMLIFSGEGQQRAALNMMWEWVGLGLTFSLSRRLLATFSLRGTLIQAFLTTIVVLSVYGIWQHHWMYDQLAQEYLSVRKQYDAAVSPAEKARFQQELLAIGVPPDSLEGSSRLLFEQRLLDSSEPLGMFALANTFAGLLAVGFLIAVAQSIHLLFSKTLHTAAKTDRLKSWILLLPTLLIGYCLILTKSRTAWVGVLAGLVSLAHLSVFLNPRTSAERQQRWQKRTIKWGLAGTVLVTVFFLLAAFSGGFDQAVLTEAPKSLQYRLEYWTGTWGVIQEKPILGTGPGNFRNHYLKHKLPGSSEEISDPHNLILDVWANAGIIALAGLLTVLALAVYYWVFKPGEVATRLEDPPLEMDHVPDRQQILLISGFVLSFPLLWAAQLFLQSIDEFRLWLFCLGWLAVYFPLQFGWQALPTADRMHAASSFVPLALAAAFVALCVHLLGAGGIAMPAITQTWLLLLALAFPVSVSPVPHKTATAVADSSVKQNRSQPRSVKLALLVASVILLFFFVGSAFAPTIAARNLVREAEQTLMRGQSARIAQRFFQQAAQADPKSPAPWQALAELQFQQATNSQDAFEQAVKLKQTAIEHDPANPLNYFHLGQRFYQHYQSSQRPEDLKAAILNLTQAVDRYPNNSRYRAALAEALSQVGEIPESQLQASRAMELDEANHRGQHSDKYLPEETVNQMNEIINATQTNQN